ncbi:aminofutalosine synthase MqnE [Deinococcus misasensis]|uniref:aminofutalosine synthase MqnE n=1 Tax=Deinococcus misasensis TaxID=392413 RepID=UPI00054E0E7F|nr:aminofutalosine synthase MqnE [Deinococcus misasensis]
MKYIRDPELIPIAEKVEEGQRLSFEEGLKLYHTPDLNTLARLANLVRERKFGDKTYYVHSLRLSQTNICYVGCTFCGFAAHMNEERAWDWDIEDVLKFVRDRYQPGLTEIHISSGHHPKKPWSYYLELVRALKDNFPGVQVKAWTAAEIWHFTKIAKLSVREVLTQLKEAGLDAMPGGGAEIFAERVRKQIARAKVNADNWLDVHRTAHQIGLRTNATMLYGHIETLDERLDHMHRLRDLQDETGGFYSFIPLAFQPMNNSLAMNLGKTDYTTGLDDLRNLAVARIYLDNFDHIKGYWIQISPELTQVALDWGVTDIDGTIIEEKISHAAGATSEVGTTEESLRNLILKAGRTPVLRDALYNELKIGSGSAAD